MRTKKELYSIILEEFLKGDIKGLGFICNLINRCEMYDIISKEEHVMIINDFQSQKPTKKRHEDFYNSPLFVNSCGWWDCDIFGNRERVRFLKKLISINS